MIILAGTARVGPAAAFGAARIGPDGALDTGFGSGERDDTLKGGLARDLLIGGSTPYDGATS